MFTGIVEATGKVVSLQKEGTNLHLEIECDFSPELKIDQSVAHNGVCLTVTSVSATSFTVTAIRETLDRTNFRNLQEGNLINLERSMLMNGRIDGHMVQGHVDKTAICSSVKDENGSWLFSFNYEEDKKSGFTTVEKGSVCVNGVSLTVTGSAPGSFSVAIIPYTFEHTNFRNLKQGDLVNIEFDIIGKYVAKYLDGIKNS